MKVFCKYDDALDLFLKKVIKYILNLYGDSLDISEVQEIQLVNIKESRYDSDGRTYSGGKKIILTSRLYDSLPSYDIKKLERNEIFKLIVNTIFHEMGHATDWKLFPNMYNAVEEKKDIKQYLPAFFWLEYIAEKRSCVYGFATDNDDKFCNDFVKRKWRVNKFDFSSLSENNFLYLNKSLSYFMGKTTQTSVRDKYLDKMENHLLRAYILDLQAEITELEKIMPFDDTVLLRGIYDIMSKYYKMFIRKFELFKYMP